MPYISNTDQDRAQMLATIGVGSFEDLLKDIPGELRLKGGLVLPAALPESALARHVEELAGTNKPVAPQDCYLGGGAFVTHIPEAVKSLALRSEYITAYTPYQAEVSQGTLQTVFEFQTMIAELAGMDIANASLYDGSTALVEAIRMALSVAGKGRNRVLVCGSLYSRWAEVLETYFHPLKDSITIEFMAEATATTPAMLSGMLGEDLAALVVQSPNAHGLMEDVPALANAVHEANALLIQVFDPIAVALFQSPGEAGADIAVAEGQPIAQPLQYGGPYIGLFATREEWVKQVPGRLIGQTLDTEGNTGYVLAFQTREQHIRREKATSNICTNEALVATFTTIHLALLGPEGLKDKAQSLYTRASWLADTLKAKGYELIGEGERFREVAVRIPGRDSAIARMREAGILAGLPIPGSDEGLLIAVNEFQEKQDLERYLQALEQAGEATCRS